MATAQGDDLLGSGSGTGWPRRPVRSGRSPWGRRTPAGCPIRRRRGRPRPRRRPGRRPRPRRPGAVATRSPSVCGSRITSIGRTRSGSTAAAASPCTSSSIRPSSRSKSIAAISAASRARWCSVSSSHHLSRWPWPWRPVARQDPVGGIARSTDFCADRDTGIVDRGSRLCFGTFSENPRSAHRTQDRTPGGSFASAAAWSKLVREVREQGPPRLQPLDHRERLADGEMGGMRLGPEGIEDERVQALEQAPALLRESD